MARLLFVTCRIPYPPRGGQQLRSWHLLEAAAWHHDVVLLSLRRSDDPDTLPVQARRILADFEAVALPDLHHPLHLVTLGLRWIGSRRTLFDIRFCPPALHRAFRRHVRECDLVHLDMLPLAGLLPDLPHGVPCVLNEHNVESALMHSQIDFEDNRWRRLLLQAKSAGVEKLERRACQHVSHVLACSEIDARELERLAPCSRISVIPNGADTATFAPAADEATDPDSLVFVGQMSWLPNRDGIEYFMRDILPRIKHRPNLRVDVIGRNDGEISAARIPAGVHFHGFVEDLRSMVRRAAVFIVPLRVGSGTRLKALEAMAMGKAIVSTSKGVEGIGLVDGHSALIADTPAEFAAAVEKVLDDPDLRRRLGLAARKLAVNHYDWGTIGRQLLSVYDELLCDRVGRAEGLYSQSGPC
jgi:polysaccharide biosynthesis protein PslH